MIPFLKTCMLLLKNENPVWFSFGQQCLGANYHVNPFQSAKGRHKVTQPAYGIYKLLQIWLDECFKICLTINAYS